MTLLTVFNLEIRFKSGLRRLFVLLPFLIWLGTSGLLAHHGTAAPPSGTVGGLRLIPGDFLSLELEYLKGEADNRQRLIGRFGLELGFLENRLGLRLSVPYEYYVQKNRENAGRYGRPRIGLRFAPGLEEIFGPEFFMNLDLDYGFAAGSDRTRFIDENYQDSRAGIGLGWNFESFLVQARFGGIFPLSRLPNAEILPTDPRDSGYRAPWLPAVERVTRDTHDLKKVSEASVFLGFRPVAAVLIHGGFSYRTPFAGAIKEKAGGNLAPKIYRDLEAGLSWEILENLALSLSYRYPLFRARKLENSERLGYLLTNQEIPNPKEYRLLDESYRVSVVFGF